MQPWHKETLLIVRFTSRLTERSRRMRVREREREGGRERERDIDKQLDNQLFPSLHTHAGVPATRRGSLIPEDITKLSSFLRSSLPSFRSFYPCRQGTPISITTSIDRSTRRDPIPSWEDR
mmetsp:Transcript_20243/g.40553  ORF Transcript_20243/g.40553 Transcript_20243/m.40553 type:complete len:121 (-) Transcript_20243:262-624(-)